MSNESSTSNNWFVYIIEASDNRFYTGITTDIVIDSPASDEDIARLTEAVHKHCPVLDIIKNATPITFTVRKKDLPAVASHAL